MATMSLELVERRYRATPELFEVHQQGTLALKDVCLRFAVLFDPAEPPAPAPDEALPSPPEPDCPVFDTAKFVLGKLCAEKHEWGQTGQTLLRKNGRYCPLCHAEKKRQARRSSRVEVGDA